MKPRIRRHVVVQPQDPSYRLIPLTQGQNAIVDADDFLYLSQFIWFANWDERTKTFYAIRHNENHGSVRMHREIIKCSPREQCDHKNFNGLDNRKNNLRKCTRSQNCANRRPFANNKTGYKGVSRVFKKWKAVIKKDGIKIHIGMFSSPQEAARAYDAAAKIYHGEFAYLNHI